MLFRSLRAMLADGTTVFHEILEDVADDVVVQGDGAA